MSYSNFKLIEKTGRGVYSRYTATIDVTTGFWIFKQVKTRKIHREVGGNWFFIDTGRFTLGYEVEALERAFKATQGKDLDECELSVC